ncbi:MAG: TolC family protein [Alphaproteobacteria bacterium]
MTNVISNVLVVLGACGFLISCTANRVTLDAPSHKTQLAEDLRETQNSQIPKTLELTTEQALQRALAYNLDARVSALEALSREDDIDLARLQALPNLQISSSYLGRSNKGASSSRSVISGNQSLEPSYSTDRYRATTEMSASWDILNIMLAVAQSRIAKDEALIARQRHEKVIDNIQRDVFGAYWRAKAFIDTKEQTLALIDQTKEHIANIELAEAEDLLSKTRAADLKNEFIQQYEALREINNDLALAEIELKSLLSLPQDTTLHLVSESLEEQKAISAFLKADLETLEEEALLYRPEMRETYIQKNIDRQNVRNEILRTLPGAELFFAANKDTNQFLADSDWLSYSASLTQNLISLFTLPARKRAAENLETLGDARRISLAAAILTQVHLARHRMQAALEEYKDAKRSGKIASELARAAQQRYTEGLTSMSDVLPVALKAQADEVRALQAQAAMMEALASMYSTLGRDIPLQKEGLI